MDKLGLAAQFRLVAKFSRGRLATEGAIGREASLRQIRNIVRLAYDKTEFYRDKFDAAGFKPSDLHTWRDFAAIPHTTKIELLSAGPAAHIGSRIAKAFLSRTSGSSGIFLNLYAGSDFWIKDGIIGVNAYRRYVNLKAGDRILYGNTSQYPFTSVGGLLYRVAYFDNLRPVEELIEELISRRPEVLMAYPSIAADIMQKCPPSLPALKAVITHSEQSSQEFRSEIGKFFQCPVYDEYATEELGRVAVQCGFGTYHLIERQSYCEIVAPDSGFVEPESSTGELVGTCLINTTMPIIRYRQGDLASITRSDCPCGERGRILGSLLGRRNASFSLPDGSQIASGRLLDWTYHLILTSRLDILQFELVQIKHDLVRFFIVPGAAYDYILDRVTIKGSFRKLLTDRVDLQVVEVPSLARTGAGKRVLIRSEIDSPTKPVNLNGSIGFAIPSGNKAE
ncbi:phenylacetate--CoA ligase family protein [Amycolatopsis sp. NPDC059090]|uniref:phenylacetate--CoA ligase family protein n=1 Tax=Amycolatopsis sp. NPDC059090 TaxID=3346723 RepID=UPI00366A728A